MFYSDLHTHTLLSDDGHAPLSDMAQAAAQAGMAMLCATDHHDMLTEDGRRNLTYDWGPALRQFAETAPRFEGTVALRLGLELGSVHVSPPHARAIVTQAGDALDMVIGSIHNFREENGGGEYFYARFDTPELCRAALEDYFTSMEELVAQSECYDVLGHIIYPLRYMRRDGQKVSLLPYRDRLAGILTAVIATGKSIEVNTCRGTTVEDWRDILTLYRDLGGTLVTTGSDAHLPDDVGKGIRQACALLQSCGFERLTVYSRRRPSWRELS